MLNRIYQLARVPELTATWANSDGSATIYITDDPAANQITLTVTNGLEEPIKLPPGSPAELGKLPPGACALYLYFSGLLTNEQIAKISVDSEGWASASFVDPATEQRYLAMAPTDGVALDVGGELVLRLRGVTASGSPTSGYADLYLMGAQGVDDGTDLQMYLTITHPPKPGDKELRLLVGFAEGGIVYIGAEQGNRLLLFLTNPGTEPLVPDGTSAWGPDDPAFRLSFVCGDGSGALTTVDLARQIEVDLDDAYGNVWKQPKRDDQGEYPRWLLRPDRNGGGTVLGTGESATVTFDITEIVTTLPPGVTYAHVGYQNIPGYNDGFFALELVKIEPIVVESFTATPGAVTDATQSTEITLSFAVRNAGYVTILNSAYAKPASGLRFEDTTVAKISTTTTFTLLAQNPATGQQYAKALTVPVSPDPFGMLPTGTVVMWSGAADAPPKGWALCDGEDGRPNLVDRFVLGAGDRKKHPDVPEPKSTGGQGTHTHKIAAQASVKPAPEHHHMFPDFWYDNWVAQKGPVNVIDRNTKEIQKSHTQPAGGHDHEVHLDAQSSSADSRPPWYALCYIVKVAPKP